MKGICISSPALIPEILHEHLPIHTTIQHADTHPAEIAVEDIDIVYVEGDW
jgi:hypothetical protein